MWTKENVPKELIVWAKEIFKQTFGCANWIILVVYVRDGER
jgi:hypothetical protein